MNEEKSFFEILSLCLHSRCPVCKKGALFQPLSRLNSPVDFFLPLKNCDQCGFRFGREPGYYFGVLTPTLPILSLATGLVFVVGGYLLFHPEDPHDLIPMGALGVAIGFILFWRASIAIFMSFDHAIDPPKWPLRGFDPESKLPRRNE